MKVSAILGSPRKKGVTTTLATEFMQQLAKNGADTQFFHLNEMVFKGCQGCQGCKARSGSCVLEDDLTRGLEQPVTVPLEPSFEETLDQALGAIPDPVLELALDKALDVSEEGLEEAIDRALEQ